LVFAPVLVVAAPRHALQSSHVGIHLAASNLLIPGTIRATEPSKRGLVDFGAGLTTLRDGAGFHKTKEVGDMLASARAIPLSRQTLWRTGLALVLLLVGAASGLAIRSTFATHGGTTTVHACVNLFTGHTRIMLPGRPPNCTSSERLVEWNSDSGTVSSGINEFELPFVVPAGQITTTSLACPDPNDEAIGGGAGGATVGDVPFLVMRQSLRGSPTNWSVTMENLDLLNDHNAVIQVFCVATS
jgi:hypothetical protein